MPAVPRFRGRREGRRLALAILRGRGVSDSTVADWFDLDPNVVRRLRETVAAPTGEGGEAMCGLGGRANLRATEGSDRLGPSPVDRHRTVRYSSAELRSATGARPLGRRASDRRPTRARPSPAGCGHALRPFVGEWAASAGGGWRLTVTDPRCRTDVTGAYAGRGQVNGNWWDTGTERRAGDGVQRNSRWSPRPTRSLRSLREVGEDPDRMGDTRQVAPTRTAR